MTEEITGKEFGEKLRKEGLKSSDFRDEEKPKKKKKLPMNFMTNEFMDQQLTTLNKSKGGKKMNGMQMQEPAESSWESIVKRLKIRITNAEKELLMSKAQLKEAESHIKEV